MLVGRLNSAPHSPHVVFLPASASAAVMPRLLIDVSPLPAFPRLRAAPAAHTGAAASPAARRAPAPNTMVEPDSRAPRCGISTRKVAHPCPVFRQPTAAAATALAGPVQASHFGRNCRRNQRRCGTRRAHPVALVATPHLLVKLSAMAWVGMVPRL